MSLKPIFEQVLSYAEPHITLLTGDMPELDDAASFFAPYPTILVLGTGGSSLGGQTLASLPQASKRCIFGSNIDPQGFAKLIQDCNPSNTGVLVISKSGETSETLMQVQTLEALWPGWTSRARAITDPKPNSLRTWAEHNNVKVYDHAPVGGRYSIFSNVGLIPAKLCGLDVAAFRKGALSTLQSFASTPANQSGALIASSQNVEWMQKGFNISVVWVYADALRPWALWYAQLWAESLGKKTSDGVSVGSTLCVAHGTVDQHSQLQLYLDGPNDKTWIIITTEHIQEASSPYAPMGRLMHAHQQAVIDTLRANNKTLRHIHIPTINEQTIGEWMAHNMLEVWSTAEFLHVNPINQDAVEQVKKRVREAMSQQPHSI